MRAHAHSCVTRTLLRHASPSCACVRACILSPLTPRTRARAHTHTHTFMHAYTYIPLCFRPDNAHPQSSDGSVPAGATPIHSNWVFFAVTYAAEDVAGNVKWYFGASDTAALLDTNSPTARTIYNKGKVNDPNLPLAFGNFGSGYVWTVDFGSLRTTGGLRGSPHIRVLSSRWQAIHLPLYTDVCDMDDAVT